MTSLHYLLFSISEFLFIDHLILSMNSISSMIRYLLFILFISLILMGCRTTEMIPDEPDIQPKPEETADEVTETPPLMAADLEVNPKQELRAVWVATVANIDWPSAPGLPVEQQKKEMIDLLDRAAALHFNAIIFQVRPAADALYNSPYEPWSYYLTGKMGEAPLPAYDPLEFAVREAHKRGMELHAWFNPYRALHPTHRSEISPDHISQTHPDFVHQYGDFLWLDPGNPEAKEHTINVILDVVERYDIDGVHFDDYFYPYPSYADGDDFPDSLSWQLANNNGNTLSRDNWRRENVNSLMKEISQRIKEIKPHVKFGISPFGIWRPGYPENTTGFDAFTMLYADARLWLKEGWVDYFTPQIYYRMDQIAQPFPVMLRWWAEQNHHERHLWPGLFTSRVRTTDVTWPVQEIKGQVYTARGFPGVNGTVHFSMRTFLENSDNINRQIAAGPHAVSSVVPPTPWLDYNKPALPEFSITDYGDRYTLRMAPGNREHVRWWVIRTIYDNFSETNVISGLYRDLVHYGGEAMIRPKQVFLSSINRTGVEGPVAKIDLIEENKKQPSVDLAERLVPRNEWAHSEPGGVEANAIRRNISMNDTLRFKDLTLIFSNIIRVAPVPAHLFKGTMNDDEPDAIGKETVTIQLYRNGVSETVTLQAGESLNWFGYHIGLLNIRFSDQLAEFELATTASLPVDRASLLETGSASNRLKVPHRIQKITLHHTGSPEPLTPRDDPATVLNNLLDWSFSDRNWWDVPYHYLIGLDGTIYEGRDADFAGDTNTAYDPRGHLLVSLIGNYNLQEPTSEQLEAIAELMAHSIQKYGLTIDDIYGHDELADTTCPGTYLRPFLDDGTLIRMVEEILE